MTDEKGNFVCPDSSQETKLFPSQDGNEVTEDVLNSNLGTRINGWRSAGMVRQMNVLCRNKRNEFLRKDLVVQGFMPVAETAEVVGFLHWLMAQDTETFATSSSDIAAIACCLCALSFESLVVENFGRPAGRETNCRLEYYKTPLYTGYGETWQDGRRRISPREVSAVVPLTQPEETFSTFPITHAVAQRCRMAWERGTDAGAYVSLAPNNPSTWDPPSKDITMWFTNMGTSVTTLRGRKDPRVWNLVSLLAIFANKEVCDFLTEIVGRETPEEMAKVVRVANAPDLEGAVLDDPEALDLFTVCQAFFMGYYYRIPPAAADTSTLEVQTVSGHWGCRSADFLSKMAQSLRRTFQSSNASRNGWETARADSHRTSIPPRPNTWEGEGPLIVTELSFTGPTEDCTRHMEADWDKMPEHVLLCIRYKGRRIGSLNPGYADIAFCRAAAAAAAAATAANIKSDTSWTKD
ncbi:hypothetical protein OQA88_11840 [Cercophora sp. LCS_1]